MKKRNLITAAALVCTASMLAGTVTAAHPLTDATFVWETRKTEEKAEEVKIELSMLNNALRQYFGLDENEPLTADLLEQVTSIRFRLSKYNGNLKGELEGMTAVKCVINDGVLPGAVYSASSNERYGELGYEIVPVVVRAKYFDTATIADDWDRNKLASFFVVKDSDDPRLTERAVAELNTMYPNTLVDAIAVCDPDTKPRELAELASLAVEHGLANMDTLIDGPVIPLHYADTELFPNLETVELLDGLGVAGNLAAEVIVENVLP